MVTQTKKKLPSYSLYDIRNLDDLRDSVLSSKDEFVAIDTETTGLDVKTGHRIIEIGCVELSNRKFTGK